MKKHHILIPIGVIISLITSLILAFSVHDNFSTYGGYYATQLPRGKGKHPELILIMKYLEHIPHPDNSQLRYDYDGVNTIIKSENYYIDGNGDFVKVYYNFGSYDSERRIHTLSKSGIYVETIHYYPNEKFDNVPIRSTIKDKNEVYQLSYKAIQPIINVQKAPPKGQNLQWLFNLVYQKQFE